MGCIYDKLVSTYEGDKTKGSGLTSNEVDMNFHFLRGADVQEITVNEEKTHLTVKFVDGKEITVEISKDNGDIFNRLKLVEDGVTVLATDVDDNSHEIERLLGFFVFDAVGNLVFDDYVFDDIYEPIVEGEEIEAQYRYTLDEDGKYIQDDNGEYKKVEWRTRWIHDSKNISDAILRLDWSLSKVHGELGELVDRVDHIEVPDIDYDDKFDLINEEIKDIKGSIETIEKVVQDTPTNDELDGVKKEIAELTERLTKVESRQTDVVEMIVGLQESIIAKAIEDVKKEILSPNTFEGTDGEISVKFEDGKMKIGFAESLLLGV